MEESQIKDQDLTKLSEEEAEFRTSIATMDRKGKRQWVFPKKPSGKFTKYRTYVSWVLLAILVLNPFIKLPNGNPVFMFNVPQGQFIIFGFPFFTSDFFLLAIGMIATIVSVLLFTVVYGRIFCGWICPQTIFMEHIFRKIEYAIEGDRAKQMRLAQQAWDEEKIRKRLLKWTVFALISFFIANIFLAYVIGSDALIDLVKQGPGGENLSTFIGLIIFTGLFYFIFAWFREQVCTLVCPYGRLQGVLIDKQTVIVAYDFKRGESSAGRAKFRKGEDRAVAGKGDCIDCKQCVVVCPTGIDIRNGTQMECIGCTACIDACDEVMEKINLPKGLIRYASEENIEKGTKFKLTGRMIAYTIALLIIISSINIFLFNRNNVEVKFLQIPGRNFKVENGNVINLYQYTLYNKTNDDLRVKFALKSHEDGTIKIIDGPPTVILRKADIKQGVVEVDIPKADISSYKERIVVVAVDEEGKELDDYSTSFAAPF